MTIANLEKLLAAGKDSAMLRFGLGSAYMKAGDHGTAAAHLQRAVTLEPAYSAAWKLLGQALTQLGQFERALEAYDRGIAAAESRGDKQAAKEMTVFARRLRKRQEG
ncbi:MAG: tetratricopeptide repeat protein [Burkholderiales bacterium]|nr:tetratricopeptide repeat protein [Burkholderiales bacterium]